MSGLKNLKRGFGDFLKREPLYIWLLVFIILVNVATLIFGISQNAQPQETARGLSSARVLMEDRARLTEALLKDKNAYSAAAYTTLSMAMLVLLGIFLDFFIMIRKTAKRDVLERSLLLLPVRWSIWDALKVMILFLSLGYAIVIVEALLVPLVPFIKEQKRVISIINTTVMDLVSIGIVIYFAVRHYGHKIKDLGLTLKNFSKNIFYGVFGYISVIPLLVVTLLITMIVVNFLGYKPPPQPVLEIFLEEKEPNVLLYLSVFVAVIGPVVEEIFFRGFLYSALKKELSLRWAIFISAALFSLLHAHVIGFAPILILGIFLAYLYEKTGSLVPCATVHILHNMAMVYLIFLIKGIHI